MNKESNDFREAMNKNERQIILNAFKHAQLEGLETDEFLSLWKPVSFSKNEMMTSPGQIEKRFYVVIEGVQVIYLFDHKGKQVVIAFSFDGSYSGVYDSFIDQEESSYHLQALTESKLYYIDHSDYTSLFERFHGFDRWGRVVHAELLKGRVKRELEISTMSSEERFRTFMRRCPKPLNQIPQRLLASYLNMTPETFSRLMNSVTW